MKFDDFQEFILDSGLLASRCNLKRLLGAEKSMKIRAYKRFEPDSF